jgi:hypothetical protein
MISRRFLFSFFLLSFLPGQSQALAAPGADVVGKSVVVRWTENRQQRINNSPELRAVTVGFELQIYVGATGRAFTRLTASSRGGSKSEPRDNLWGKAHVRSGPMAIRSPFRPITAISHGTCASRWPRVGPAATHRCRSARRRDPRRKHFDRADERSRFIPPA